MKILRWFVEEAKAIAAVMLYFAACFVVIMVLKQLWLAEYGIEFSGIATALLAALVTAKVVIILEHAPLTRRLQGTPGLTEVITRSAAYTLAVLIVMIVEKGFEARTEHGSLMMSLANIFDYPDMPKLWATTICVGLSFLAYNAFAVVVRAIGRKKVLQLFLSRNAAAV